MNKIVGITASGIQEECRWDKQSPCPRHKIHQNQIFKTQYSHNGLSLPDEAVDSNPMHVFEYGDNDYREEYELIEFVPSYYHYETKGKNHDKFILCNNHFKCDNLQHIDEKEYRQLQFNLDERVPLKDLAKVKNPPSLEDLADCFMVYQQDRFVRSKAGFRLPILSEDITESLVAYCYSGKSLRGMSGDLMFSDGSIVEVKGSSSSGPNSFSPTEWFDKLMYVKFDGNTSFDIYDTNRNRSQVENIEVKKGQSFKEQAAHGRRPRFKVDTEIIEKDSIKPSFKAVFENQRFHIIEL